MPGGKIGSGLRGQAAREAVHGYLFILPWIVGFLVFFAGPLVYSLGLSLHEWDGLSAPRFVGLQNYGTMFTQDPLFRRALWNTLLYTLSVVPLSLVGSLLLAGLLARPLALASWLRAAYYVPSLTPPVVVALVWGWVFSTNFGVLNTFLSVLGLKGPPWLESPEWAPAALILVTAWWRVGGSQMIILLAGLLGIPQELYDAADVEGANWWQRWRYVTLPQLSPAVFFVLILGVISSFQVFELSLVMTGGGPADSTLYYVLYLYRAAFESFRLGYASSLAWGLFIVLLVATVAQFKILARQVYYEYEAPGR